MLLTNSGELVFHMTVSDRRKDTGVDESKGVPFSRTLCLEVPPEPTLSLRLKGGDLGLDIASRVVFVRG